MKRGEKRSKYTVYDERVAKRLGKISQETYASVQDALRRYPDVQWRAMLSMALHLGATIATNAAHGKPLLRKWSSKPRSDKEPVAARELATLVRACLAGTVTSCSAWNWKARRALARFERIHGKR